MMKFYLMTNLTATALLSVSGLHAQDSEFVVQGVVTSASGESLPGTNVIEKGTTNGTVSDADGNFKLSVSSAHSTLVFSFIGYDSKEVQINGRSKIDMVLEPNVQSLDEVVVVGYGEQSRKTLTTAISKYKPEELADIPINTIGEGLKGKLSGVRVYNSSGQPGESPEIRIRGGSSIQKSNSPLILVDGFERDLAYVNPADIESVEALKDAAATAIYGARASNGVVLITTKKGQYNTRPEVTFQTSVTHQNIERYYDRVNAEQFLTLSRPALAKSPNPQWLTTRGFAASTNNDADSFIGLRYLNPGETPPTGWKTMPDPLDPTKTLTFVDNDLADVIFDPAFRQNYYLGISGGSENVRYSGGVGYTDDDGVVYSTGWKRFSARANTDIRVSDKLTVSTNFDYSETHPEEHSSQNNAITRQAMGAPTQRLYMDDGTPARGYNASSTAPLFWDYNHYNDEVNKRITIGTALDYAVTKHLNAIARGTHYTAGHQSDDFQRANVFNSLRPASSSFSESVVNEFEGLLKYNTAFGHHNLSAVAGASYRGIRNKSLSASAQGAVSDKVHTLNVAPEKTGASTSLSEEVLLGMFGRVSYDYRQKYLFSFSIRRDGSSRFGADNKWGIFPSASAAWNVSDEEFFRSQNTISSLKIRSSIGQTGNNDIGLYTAQGSYSLSYKYDGEAGVRNTGMPNYGLNWETTTQWDAGVEMGLLNDRVRIIADLYDKRTRDLLFSVPLPNTSGFSSIETNVGTVRFYGYDLEVSTTNIQTDKLKWETTFTISGNKNEVLKLPDNGRDKNRIGGWVVPDGEDFGGIAEGEPLYRLFGFKIDHIIDNQEEAENARWDYWAQGWDPETQTSQLGRKMPGDYEWQDRDGDGKITEYDQFELGVSVPHTVGGIGNTVSYNNFTFRVFLDYALGASQLDEQFGYSMMSTFNNNVAMPVQILDAWKQPGDAAKTKWARFAPHDTNEGRNYRRVSDARLFNNDYLCIREVSIAYQIPASITTRWGIKHLDVYVSGNNLHYFTEVLATPPEASSAVNGSNVGYPPIRKISLGLTLNL
jgi:TonB-linked SusC/RagA family outer membrane protein